MKKIIVLFILVAIASIGGSFWWYKGIQPSDSKDTSYRIFVVQKGAGIREITNNLKKERLITDPVVFFLLVKHFGLDQKIQAGDFRLSPSMPASGIALALTRGTLDIWITIPEGYRADEIADLLREKIPSYQESWRETLNEHEGYLFPDTYLIPRDADRELIVKIFRDNFAGKFEDIYSEEKTELTQGEVVTIASLVEREARHPQDRPLIASVIMNRLVIGMKLDIDATIQYALGKSREPKTWWPKISQNDYQGVRSPYNTYLTSGLPPTPIANPGLAALESVIYPAQTKYLYYYTSGKDGRNYYAESLEEHNANIKKYQL